MSASTRIKSLDSALTVLMDIPEDRSISVTQLSKDTGLTKSAVSKILATFADYGFVFQDEATKEFSLGPTIIAKGANVLRNVDLRQLVRPYLRHLSDIFNENSMLMIQQGDEALIAEYCEAKVSVRLSMRLAQRHKLYYGAAPKVILAYMPEEEREAIIRGISFRKHTAATIDSREKLEAALEKIRAEGQCFSGGEFDNNGIGIAVPVWDAHLLVPGSIAMNVPMFRVKEAPIDNMFHEMKECALKMSLTLGADEGYVREALRLF